jgi:predicted lipid-binding transport protein (Tim44 family)
MAKKTWLKVAFVCVTFLFFFIYALEADSFARVGGGRSSGFRGSRSYSTPSSTPSSPSRSYQPPSQPGSGSFGGGGGFLRNMAGGIAGGFLGSMLFRGLGFGGGWGGGGGGIGLFEIILLAVILYLVYRFVKRRREAASQGAYYESSSTDAASTYQQPSRDPGYGPADTGAGDLQSGLRHIAQMDPAFDEARFRDGCLDTFFKIQGAWAVREMSPVGNLLTDEMCRTIQNDAERLTAEKKINKLDNIAVRTTDIVEAWQESGKDYITVRFYANLLDYTIDESTGQVVTGSRTDPVKFEEYWTFVRQVGNNPWQLSAITQPQ